MTLPTAIDIAEKELAAHPDEDVKFDIFGGEPLLKRDMVKTFCEFVWKTFPERNVRFSCITNGTLIDDDIAGWMRANSHRFFCHISIDGTPDMHMLNRGVRYKEETARLFGSIWPYATAKMTISKETLSRTFEGVMYINGLGLKVAPSLARGVDWNDKDLAIYVEQLRLLVDYYGRHPELRPIDLFSESLAPVLLPHIQENYCGAGYSMCAYSPDGEKYPCQMFMPISLDRERWKEIKNVDVRADRFFYTDEDCVMCPVANLCKKCPGLNFKERGHLGVRDKHLCGFIRAEYEAVARYKIQVLSQKPFEDLTREDYIELKSASELLKRLIPSRL